MFRLDYKVRQAYRMDIVEPYRKKSIPDIEAEPLSIFRTGL